MNSDKREDPASPLSSLAPGNSMETPTVPPTVTCCNGSPSAVIPPAPPGLLRRGLWLIPALPAWFLLYHFLEPLANALTTRVFGLDVKSPLGSALAFFCFDAPKVLMLLALVVLGVTFLQTFISAERTRDVLARRAGAWGNLLAALLGIITPFCSCSAIPLFIGFVRVGVPLGVTFSYLVSAPMVNEVALFMLLAMFGWKLAALYAGTGVLIAFLSGWILGKLKLEAQLEPWVLEIPYQAQATSEQRLHLADRLELALQGVRDIVGKVWPYLLVGIAVGACIHGYVPAGLMARFLGKGNWWSVPLAVLIGIPLYSNAAGVIPIVQALLGKGAALGTTLAFMMAVIGLSLPETIILRKVLKPRLIALFVAVVATGILLVGYLFNFILLEEACVRSKCSAAAAASARCSRSAPTPPPGAWESNTTWSRSPSSPRSWPGACSAPPPWWWMVS